MRLYSWRPSPDCDYPGGNQLCLLPPLTDKLAEVELAEGLDTELAPVVGALMDKAAEPDIVRFVGEYDGVRTGTGAPKDSALTQVMAGLQTAAVSGTHEQLIWAPSGGLHDTPVWIKFHNIESEIGLFRQAPGSDGYEQPLPWESEVLRSIGRVDYTGLQQAVRAEGAVAGASFIEHAATRLLESVKGCLGLGEAPKNAACRMIHSDVLAEAEHRLRCLR